MAWGRMFPEKVSSIWVPLYVASDVQVSLPRRRPSARRRPEFSHPGVPAPPVLRIQVLHLAGVVLDKALARLDLVAHERREDLVRHSRRLDGHLEQRPVLRVHRRLPELDGVHLPETLEAPDVRVAVGVEAPQRLAQLRLGVHVVVLALVRDLVQRRLREVHVAALEELRHVPVQERQNQRADVAAVLVRVGHDDYLVVADVRYVEVLPDARAYGRDHRLYLDVGENLVHARLLDVQDLAPQGQDRLKVSLPTLLGRPAGRVALYDVELAPGRVLRRAVGELARQRRALQVALADRVADLPGRLTRPRGLERLVDDRLRLSGPLLQELGEKLVGRALDETLYLGVPELCLCLPLELGLGELDAYHGGEAFADVVAREALLLLLEEPFLARISVDGPRQRRPEPREVRAALVRVDVVRESEDGVLEAVVPLHGDLDGPDLLLPLQVEDGLVHGVLGVVYVRHEVPDAALVLVRYVPALFALVDQAYL